MDGSVVHAEHSICCAHPQSDSASATITLQFQQLLLLLPTRTSYILHDMFQGSSKLRRTILSLFAACKHLSFIRYRFIILGVRHDRPPKIDLIIHSAQYKHDAVILPLIMHRRLLFTVVCVLLTGRTSTMH